MEINGVEIEDTFAEAFEAKMARVLITAASHKWAMIAVKEATGFGTSVIMCPAEAGIDCGYVPPEETPDGRPGVTIMIGHNDEDELKEQLLDRIGQCVMTAPTASAFDAMPEAEKEDEDRVGYKLSFFGDGYQEEDELDGRKVWKIPVVEGEFIVEDSFGITTGVAGGNFYIMAESQPAGLQAAEAAVDAIKGVEGAYAPFPGGIVASASKVGSKQYDFLPASTNDAYCPTVEDNELPEGVKCVYEIVINGLNEEAVKEAMRVGIEAACQQPGVVKISAGNFGGKLGQYEIHLHDLF
ncbi:formylmethanofuran--tetrahydromethanopterin N-formyltransferase [Methanopyrus kandleri]|uniref:Formylmethanofuran--tetrahydromethanopterin formyltransferase n=2 Tax=Methanopyrus kandleri TaxID=2320 RepID=FTR_METKA|nr:formylmethanofuran--tetrahydromethanopterin N-formyltransferase [Methanopyrus kandleri]Q49610.1 RecName: Full=Formylmethanofuran--tetrahydromethanopterin formyltransferase; Short=Ftr; AltName: Full=H4MPT formyltransferase [Methanopyrus kandleri AV19]1FTR_A Chain A, FORMYLMETHANOFURAN\:TETRAHYDROMETHANOPTERIN FORMYLTRANSFERASE [Methanopyrus kandleri]1FTR_B Chain B, FORMYLMETHANOFURAN\:TETRAHYDROMETHANOPTERIN FORMYLTRANSFERASE [Methanopyrus kandleri]1FTR_C Chain C, FORMYLMETHANOFURAN\:TETRAHYD